MENTTVSNKKNNTLLIVAIVFAVLIFICGSCIILLAFIGNSASREVKKTINEIAATITSIPNNISPIQTPTVSVSTKTGQQAELDGIRFTVNQVRESKGGEIYNPDSGKKYVELEVVIENISSGRKSFNVINASLFDNQDNNYNPELFGGANSPKLSAGDLAANQKTQGWIVFEVPESNKASYLIYKTSIFGSQGIKVDLE